MTSRTAPWTGQILHVDLTTSKVSTLPTLPYAEHYLGGRGLAIRLAWDMIPPGVKAFDPANVLFLMPGALIGTPAPSAGRVTICSLSPQGYPDEWYTRSN
ncbi:MAG: aldehyde ferredoxin oxidoreductase, partial [Chloroflexi bacterium]|nr:aldehyde ferredoxin oxidoreductase [Chloroflexota bacterium]